jgi:hypothetical protein
MTENQFTEWTYFVFSNLTFLPNYVLENEIIEKSLHLIEKNRP